MQPRAQVFFWLPAMAYSARARAEGEEPWTECFTLTAEEFEDRHALLAKLYYWFTSKDSELTKDVRCELKPKPSRGTKLPGGQLTHAVLQVRDRLEARM